MSEILRILLLEDSPTDAELNERVLHKAGIEFDSLRVDTRDAFIRALEEFRPDLILSDYKLPDFDGMAAMQIVRRDHPTVPVIMVTGVLSDIEAVELIHAGARDYVLKDRLARLPSAVQRALSVEQGIRARKMAEEKFRKISESAQDAIIMMGADQCISFWNAAAERIFGYTAAEAMGQELHALIVPAPAHTQFSHAFPHFQETGGGALIGKVRELTALRKGGEEFPVELSISATQFGGQWHAIGIVRDITERKQAEEKILATQAELQRLLDAANQSSRAMLSVIEDQKQTEVEKEHANRALATLSEVNRTLVRAASEDELLQSICQAIVRQRGYRMAWVGYKQHDENKSIKIMARAGHDEGYLDAMQLTWAETEHGMGVSGRAVRNGKTQLCQDIANDPQYLPWRDEALKRGYAASITLPLTNGEVFGILHVYSAVVNDFTPSEVALLEEMAGDLAFGVRTLHTRHERDLAQDKVQQQLAQLQDSLEDTMRAIAAIVEMRDPYTAGHQVRVADLAAAIARQMGLSEEHAHVIHLTGTVHDLGKINVPAEILSKPGKLTDLEFGLIKVHPQAGYDILKGIDFPWPIAQMVLQHHERLDGSGYPQGLKGEDILLEARILAVADVVEAISAHRPYRAGLGIEVAMEEITKNRGIFYDPQAVDACVALFREQGYSFK
ncbi:MAG: HD domain-containing phosphohydrolase [Gallionellaceae bacterium]